MLHSHANEDDDDEEMNTNSKSSLLRGENRPTTDGTEGGGSIPFCGCLSVKFYQPYFDLDTQDVSNRIWSSLFFCRRQDTFLDNFATKNPDVYGPFWISTTLIFIIAVSSHISNWLFSWMKGVLWEYDFQNVVTLSSVVYGFVCIAPMAVWILFRQLEIQINLLPIICLYGYSLFVYIPAALICLLPNEVIHWLTLVGASASAFSFLLRNLAPSLASSPNARQYAAYLMACIGILQLGFMLSLKFLYF